MQYSCVASLVFSCHCGVRKPTMKAYIIRNRFKILLASALCIFIIILNTDPPHFHLESPFENTSCYYERGGEYLSGRFRPPELSIFFHETSCRGGLNSRQACAVEAAVTANKKYMIYVFFLSPVRNFNSKSFRALKSFKRVKFARVDLLEYAKNTPLESFVASGALNRTMWKISHTSDALRYLSLYKWGGIYLDLDTVVVRRLDVLRKNWSARESVDAVAAGAMAFSRDAVGRMFAEASVRDLAEKFRGDLWGNNGPGVITRVLIEKCGTSDLAAMSADICQGFEVYQPELFYPIRWQDADQYFQPGVIISEEPHAYHLWNQFTKDKKLANDSLYAQLAKKYCPSVHSVYGDSFGD